MAAPFPPAPPPVPPTHELAARNRRRTRWLVGWVVAMAVLTLLVGAGVVLLLYPWKTSWADVHQHSCVDNARDAAAASAAGDRPSGLHVVPCFETHDGWIGATGRVPDEVGTDPAVVGAYVVEWCHSQQQPGMDSEALVPFPPDAEDLAAGDRAMVCAVVGYERGKY